MTVQDAFTSDGIGRLDARHLALLRELADRGTVTAVARATFRTPSAVSQQLRTAERAAGLPLVEPDGRRLRLTAAGRVLADGAADVATTLSRVQRDLDALRGVPDRPVTVTALPSAAEFLVPGLVVDLAGSGVEVVLLDEDLAEADYAARAADVDVVIGHSMALTPAGSRGLRRVTLAQEPLDVAVPAGHRLAGRRRLVPDDLAGEDWVGVPEGYPFDTVRIAVEHASGRPLRVVQRVRDNHVVAALVAAGVGCALLPRFTTRPRPGMAIVPLDGVRAVRSIVALARPDRAERPAVATVLAALQRIAAAAAPPR